MCLQVREWVDTHPDVRVLLTGSSAAGSTRPAYGGTGGDGVVMVDFGDVAPGARVEFTRRISNPCADDMAFAIAQHEAMSVGWDDEGSRAGTPAAGTFVVSPSSGTIPAASYLDVTIAYIANPRVKRTGSAAPQPAPSVTALLVLQNGSTGDDDAFVSLRARQARPVLRLVSPHTGSEFPPQVSYGPCQVESAVWTWMRIENCGTGVMVVGLDIVDGHGRGGGRASMASEEDLALSCCNFSLLAAEPPTLSVRGTCSPRTTARFRFATRRACAWCCRTLALRNSVLHYRGPVKMTPVWLVLSCHQCTRLCSTRRLHRRHSHALIVCDSYLGNTLTWRAPTRRQLPATTATQLITRCLSRCERRLKINLWRHARSPFMPRPYRSR